MPHTFIHMTVHVVFGTKDRAPSITPEMKAPLYAYMGGIIRELNAKPLKINGTSDHVHLLIGLPASISLSELVRVLKTNSSRWAHEKWPDHARFGWQQGYGAFSVSRSSIEDVESYIERQEEHHRKLTFQDEFVALLQRHGIPYDERYLWE
ncbi:MAG: IS200/IS605 family transposase [Chloroflexia bacterium]